MILGKNYVDLAEKTIIKQSEKDRQGKEKLDRNGNLQTKLTTSKIRNILDMTSDIYNEISRTKEEKIPEEIKEKLQYLRIKIVYESGREPAVKKFTEDAQILEIVKEIYEKGKKEDLITFCKYMEALVAYFKYIYGGNK